MFARALAGFRFLLIVAVLGCLAVAAQLLFLGAARIVATSAELLRAGAVSASAVKKLSLAAIELIDLFLIATVAYITAVGLYTLFISRDVPLPVRLGIENLDDLKDKIIGVLVVALGVMFLGQAASWDGAREVLHLGAGMALVIAALTYFVSQKGKQGGTGKDPDA